MFILFEVDIFYIFKIFMTMDVNQVEQGCAWRIVKTVPNVNYVYTNFKGISKYGSFPVSRFRVLQFSHIYFLVWKFPRIGFSQSEKRLVKLTIYIQLNAMDCHQSINVGRSIKYKVHSIVQ